MRTNLPAELGRIAQGQNGVFSRKQALRAGMTEYAIKYRVRSEVWRRLYPGVYTIIPVALSREACLWAAVLYAGSGAVLSHQTAAELHGLTDKPTDPIHMSIPSDRRVTGRRGLRVHVTNRALDPPDAHRDPPHTTIEETLLDLVMTAVDFDEACGWITRAFGRELTSAPRLLAAMSARTLMRWRPELKDVISSSAAGDHSVLEYRYTRDVERAHRLPTASRQVPFTRPDGGQGRRDRVYKDYGVVIELDGNLAHRPEESWRDKARDRAAAADGLKSLRYGWTDVHGNSCVTAAEVAKILRNRGWPGSPRSCSLSCPAGA